MLNLDGKLLPFFLLWIYKSRDYRPIPVLSKMAKYLIFFVLLIAFASVARADQVLVWQNFTSTLLPGDQFSVIVQLVRLSEGLQDFRISSNASLEVTFSILSTIRSTISKMQN